LSFPPEFPESNFGLGVSTRIGTPATPISQPPPCFTLNVRCSVSDVPLSPGKEKSVNVRITLPVRVSMFSQLSVPK